MHMYTFIYMYVGGGGGVHQCENKERSHLYVQSDSFSFAGKAREFRAKQKIPPVIRWRNVMNLGINEEMGVCKEPRAIPT